MGLIALVFAITGCASTDSRESEQVTHVVICWLKNPGNAGERQQLIDRSKQFTAIPGVRRVSVGTVRPGLRPQVESTFDVGLVIEFDDAEALRAYDEHPMHQQAVREVLQPLASRFVVYDFVNR
jgi:hypothetical protein